MSVQTNGSAGQEPGAGTPGQGQEPTPTQQQGQQPQGGQQGGQEPTPGQVQQDGQQQGQPQKFDPSTIQDPQVRAVVERIVRDAEEARAEAARHRTEARTLQEQVQQFQRQNETDEQRREREAQETAQRLQALEQENRALKVGAALTAAATQAQAFNPARVAALLDAQVELDDQGKPTNVDALIASLRESDPYLFRRAATGADAGAGAGGAGGDTPAGVSINDMLRRRASRAR